MAERTELLIHGILTPVIQLSGKAGEVEDPIRAEIAALEAEESRDAALEAAKQAGDYVSQATKAATAAESSAVRAEAARDKQPIIRDGTWWVWNAESGAYQNTGVRASGSDANVTTDNIKKALGYTPADEDKTVGVAPQVFTDAQKEQARKNIGAVGFEQLPDIICTAQGEIISLSDSSNRELKGLRIFGKTTQDGTPSPDAPVELVSVGESGSVGVTVCGGNLLDARNSKSGVYSGLTLTNRGDGSYSRVGTATSRFPDIWFFGNYGVNYTEPYITLLPGKSYFVGDCALYNGVTTITEPYTNAIVTVDPDRYPNGIPVTGIRMVRVTVDQTYNDIVCPRIFEGTVDHGWEPYKDGGSLTVSTPNGLPGIPVTSGGNYTDANGQQWVCDEVDFARGVYVQRVLVQVIGPETTMTLNSSADFDEANATRVAIEPSVRYMGGYGLCSHARRTNWANMGDEFGVGTAGGDRGVFYISITGKYTLDEMRAILDGCEVQLVRKTPVEMPLSAEELAQYAALHTNYPNTTIFNDAGADMEVSYAADTKTYIDNKFAQLAAAVMNNA